VVKERGEIRDEVQNLIVYQPSAGLGGTSLIEVAKDGSMKWGKALRMYDAETPKTPAQGSSHSDMETINPCGLGAARSCLRQRHLCSAL